MRLLAQARNPYSLCWRLNAEREYRGYGFRVRSFSDKIDYVNFAQNSRPGMTVVALFLRLRAQPLFLLA
jgi:hypothetical protein